MLKEFRIEKDKMPRIVSPETIVGNVCPDMAKVCHLPGDVKVIAGCGDTAASSLGAGITHPGLAYDVAGTASVFACCTNEFIPDKKKKTILFARSVCKDLFLPLAYISGGGLCIKWFSSLLAHSYDELNQMINPDMPCDTPFFFPHFSGRTCPLDDRVTGAFINLRSSMDAGMLYRSILESIAYEYKSYFDILLKKECVNYHTKVRCIGGGAKSPEFSKIKANVLGLTYTIPDKVDSAPVAMALLAAHAIGAITKSLQAVFEPETVAEIPPDTKMTAYYMPRAAKYLHLLNGFGKYVE